MMTKVTVFLGLSLDGYIAGPNNELDWLNCCQTDPPEDSGFHDLLNSIDCMIMGRNTYDTVLPFGQWPYEGKRVIVLTSREATSKYGETFYSGSLIDLIKELNVEGIKHIYLDGGLEDLTIQDRELLKPLGRGQTELKKCAERAGLFFFFYSAINHFSALIESSLIFSNRTPA